MHRLTASDSAEKKTASGATFWNLNAFDQKSQCPSSHLCQWKMGCLQEGHFPLNHAIGPGRDG